MTTAPDVSLVILSLIVIHGAEDRGVKRAEILRELKRRGYEITDRYMRSCIEDLRKSPQGATIATAKNGGYFMAQDRSQLERALKRDISRFKSIAVRVAMQGKLAGLPPYSKLLQAILEAGGEA